MKNISTLVTMAAVLVCFGAARSAAADGYGMYVFGDSLVDVGNNDFLPSPAPRANPPYGVDLPRSNTNVTGRFTNGYNLADVTAQYLGLKMSPPAYLALTPAQKFDLFVKCRGSGVNYASGGSGILDTTGKGTLTLQKQIQYFKRFTVKMTCTWVTWNYFRNSFFLISAGGNDLSAFMESQADMNKAPAYIANMVSTYINHIKALYELGARRLAILAVPPVGCVPGMRAAMNGECFDAANLMAQQFNNLLKTEMARAVTSTMSGLRYSIGNTYNVLSDIMANPLLAGIKEVKRACCGAGKLNAEVMCSGPNTTYCANRDEYMFWDKIHGTQATYERGIFAIFYGPAKYAEPINFSQLAQTTPRLAVADE